MKQIIVTISIVLLLLVGCSPKAEETEQKQPSGNQMTIPPDDAKEFSLKKLIEDTSSFHFAVDWLTATDIVFVDKNDEHYFVKIFNTTTGKVNQVYESEAIIVDVIVHPSKETLLIHTTTDSSSAVVKILSIEGMVLDEISIASSELSIEWNKIDPTLVLLTAFYEDWSYDVFLYNGTSDEFNILTMESPFPKWLGTEKIVFVKEQALTVFHYKTAQYEQMVHREVLFFDTYEDSLLTMQVNDEEKVDVQIVSEEGDVLSRWEMPVAVQYGESLFPNMSWLGKDSVMMIGANKSGDPYEAGVQFNLVHVKGGEQRIIVEDVENAPLRCTMDGEMCLSGFNKDKLIHTITSKIINWVIYK